MMANSPDSSKCTDNVQIILERLRALESDNQGRDYVSKLESDIQLRLVILIQHEIPKHKEVT